MLAVALLIPLDTPGAEAAEATVRTLTFVPVADAGVYEGSPAVNYGTATRLASDGDLGFRIESYLRFDLNGISGTVRSATLRLYVVSDGTADGPAVHRTGSDWTETGISWETRPPATGVPVADMGAAAAGSWVELDVTPAVAGDGTLNLLLRQAGTDGAMFYSRQGTYKPQLVVSWLEDPIVMAAGDIACAPGAAVTATTCRHQFTSDLLVSEPGLTAVLALGDNQYENALYSEFTGIGAYDATWGRVKSITRPVPGNHEYHVPGALGYFEYFGEAAGQPDAPYYSFDLGSWHLVALNSEISTAVGSPQLQWLNNDLASTRQRCILAYWHTPLYSSGVHGGALSLGPLWGALYNAHADVVLTGHDHDYERFARQDSKGRAHPNGIRGFVVGTGGASHTPFVTTEANSEVRDSTAFGVLRLRLRGSSYDWRFVPETGANFTDSGSATCHDSPPVASLTVSPSSGPTPLAVTADASSSTHPDGTPIAGYNFDFGDGSPVVGPQAASTAAHTYTEDGTYTVTVTVTDDAGMVGTATKEVAVKSNFIRNTGFERDTSGWNTTGSGPGITLATVAGGHSGDAAAQLTNTATTTATCTLNDSPDWVKPTTAGTYTGTIWVRADTEGAPLRLRFREWTGATLVGSATAHATLSTSWQPVTVTYKPVAPGSSTLDYNAYVPGAAPGTCFYADDAGISLDWAPAASLTLTPSSGAAPLAVVADASRSIDPDATPIVSYSFDFGDGTPVLATGPEPTAVHTYTSNGTYTVTVTATDAAGQIGRATAHVVVKPNLIRNPGFETDTSGWNTSGSGSGITLARAAGGHMSDWAARLTNTGASASTCTLNDSPNWVTVTSAGAYTASLWVRADAPGATLKLKLREWRDSTLVGSASTQATLTTSWQQVTVTYTPAAPGTSKLDYNAYVSGAAPGTCFYADDAYLSLG